MQPDITPQPRHPSRQMSDTFLLSAVLALSGGFMDAYTYTVRGGVFANAQTGNVVLMSTDLMKLDFHGALRYLIPIVAFTLGVLFAILIRRLSKRGARLHWRQTCLLIEACIMAAVGFMPQRLNMLGNVLVSFACAMQVQSFRKVGGIPYASTMCIGNLRGGAEALAQYLRRRDVRDLRTLRYYAGVILAFAVGAGLGGNVSAIFHERTIWISGAALLIGTVMMIPHAKIDDPAE